MRTRQLWTGVSLVAITLALSGWSIQAQDQARPAVAPSAPGGLTYLVNGGNVSLFWTHSTGPFTHYVIEAGGSPGTTFFAYSTSVLVNPNTLPQLISAFSTSGVGAGNYYVRVRGANGAELSPASNETLVPVTGGCQMPSSPTQFNAIVRGTTGWLQWTPGAGGLPTSYTLLASAIPGGAPIAVFPTSNPFLNVGGIPTGTYYVRVLAQNACGQSAPSGEITVVAPSNTALRSANPTSAGRLPLPFVWDTIRQIAQARPDLVASSCPSRPGFSDGDIEARKTQPNGFLNAVVDALRQIDQRFGYNSKPTRQNAIVAGDEIAYHYGADAPEGSPNVHLVDILSGHCTFGREEAFYRVFTNGEFGRWTGAGRF